jgi:hypothetical protein
MAAKRAPTPFFVFSEEQRESTRAECIANADTGAKVSVATVAKAIGEKWRALSDEEKAGYKEKAAQRVQQHAEASCDPADDEGETHCTRWPCQSYAPKSSMVTCLSMRGRVWVAFETCVKGVQSPDEKQKVILVDTYV